jgi:hypothetical protein
LYVRPPRIKVVNHELHHKVFNLIEGGQNEAAGTDTEDSDVAVEDFFEAQLDVKPL